MPRTPRLKSKSGIYHIVARGINKQTIFEEPYDKSKFLYILLEYKEICKYDVFAYCLMDNHIHLILKENEEPVSNILKRILSKYVYWYNNKYERIGHLFQDRFKSDAILGKRQFLNVLRYVHTNPIRANICNLPEHFVFSSYNEYFSIRENTITKTDFAFNLMSHDDLKKFHINRINEPDNDSATKYLDINENYNFRLPDEKAKKLISEICGFNSVSAFQNQSLANRRKYICEMRKHNMSIRQISRLTGMTKYFIEKAISMKEDDDDEEE